MLATCTHSAKFPLSVFDHRPLRHDFSVARPMHPTIPLSCNVYHSPLRQAQEQVLLCTLREARNPEPADSPVAILIFRASADTNGVFDNIATGRGRVDGGSVGQAADKLHLCERAGSGGREGAGAGAREGGAEGEHFGCVLLERRLCLDMVDGCVVAGLKEWKCYAY